MDAPSLKCLKIQRDTVDSFNTIETRINIAGEKDHASSHNGQSINIGDEFASVGQILAWILLQ
jgi:hypothetical protein